ncbi:MAG: alpha/beta hydrolase [Alphaproteobacteria bacterium]|nr:alpha/beta hydrolase [Alphaproteobacteria bacterium]
MIVRILAAALAAFVLSAVPAAAFPVGERDLMATSPTAALRDAQHRSTVRVTVWYPAAPGAREVPLTIGPPDKPLFVSGSAAPDAPFADGKRRPIVLFSHGFGGTARMMGWFGTALAEAGYVVVAVDHPGNNGRDPMTLAGATLFWDRPGDLRVALAKVEADPDIAPHLYASRLAVAGFSAGGFTALASAGAKVDLPQLEAFCRDNPADGVCAPQKEFPVTQAQAEAALKTPALAAQRARADGVHAVPGVKAVFVMAPAIVQAFDPASLQMFTTPVAIVLGSADRVAPPRTNGLFAAHRIPNAELTELAGVGHYDFLARCTDAGDATVPLCRTKEPKGVTHRAAIGAALAFLGHTIGAP